MNASGKYRSVAMVAAASGLSILLVVADVQAQRVRPTLDLTSVRLEVTWVEDLAEIERIRREFRSPHHDRRSSASIDSRTAVRGFSVLRRTADGTLICSIYVRKPQRVDDRLTLLLGHEIAHCLLGDYH